MPHPARVLERDDVRRLVQFVATNRHPLRDRAIVLLSFKAGLRACEIAGLSWTMVLRANGHIGDQLLVAASIAKNGTARQSLAAMHALQETGAEALAVVEAHLASVSLVDAMLSPMREVRSVMRPLLRASLGPRLDRMFIEGARALRRIDARLEGVALRHGALGYRPPLPRDDAVATAAAGAWLPDTMTARLDDIGSAITAAVPDGVRDLERGISSRIKRTLGGTTGAHDRLRAAAAEELTEIWAGPGHTGAKPFLSQLLDSIDSTAEAARKAIS